MITMDLRDLSSVEKMNVLTEIDQAKSGSPEAVAFLRQGRGGPPMAAPRSGGIGTFRR